MLRAARLRVPTRVVTTILRLTARNLSALPERAQSQQQSQPAQPARGPGRFPRDADRGGSPKPAALAPELASINVRLRQACYMTYPIARAALLAANQKLCQLLEELKATGRHIGELPKGTVIMVLSVAANAQNAATVESALDELQRHSSPYALDIAILNCVVKMYVRTNQPERVERMLQHMKSNNVTFDQSTFATLMSFYAKAGDAERVTSLYQSMRQLHLIPNIQILTSVLSAFARAGNESSIDHILMEMPQFGIDPDLACFTVIIQGFHKSGLVSMVPKLLSQMQSLNLKPDLTLVESVISLYGAHGNQGNVKQLLRLMASPRFSRHLSITHYRRLFHDMIRRGLSAAAVAIYEDMIAHQLKPDEQIKYALIHELARCNDVKRLSKLYKATHISADFPDKAMAAVVDAGMQAGDAELLWRAFEDMRRLRTFQHRAGQNLLPLYQIGDALAAFAQKQRSAEATQGETAAAAATFDPQQAAWEVLHMTTFPSVLEAERKQRARAQRAGKTAPGAAAAAAGRAGASAGAGAGVSASVGGTSAAARIQQRSRDVGAVASSAGAAAAGTEEAPQLVDLQALRERLIAVFQDGGDAERVEQAVALLLSSQLPVPPRFMVAKLDAGEQA